MNLFIVTSLPPYIANVSVLRFPPFFSFSVSFLVAVLNLNLDDPKSDTARVKPPNSLLNGASEKTLHLMTGVQISRFKDAYSADKTIPYDVELFQIGNISAGKIIPPTPERSEELVGVGGEDPNA